MNKVVPIALGTLVLLGINFSPAFAGRGDNVTTINDLTGTIACKYGDQDYELSFTAQDGKSTQWFMLKPLIQAKFDSVDVSSDEWQVELTVLYGSKCLEDYAHISASGDCDKTDQGFLKVNPGEGLNTIFYKKGDIKCLDGGK